MASVDGTLAGIVGAGQGSGARVAPDGGNGPDYAGTGAEPATASFQMIAWDSVTAAPYTWIATSRDWSGTGYPGPNSPTNVTVSGVL